MFCEGRDNCSKGSPQKNIAGALMLLAIAACLFGAGKLMLELRRDLFDERQAKLREMESAYERDE